MKIERKYMFRWKLLLFLSVTIFQFSVLRAEETIIVGEVFSELTNAPVGGVNIHFRGTKIGTSSDETGAFALRVDLRAPMQLVFSAVGYHTQRYEIQPGAMAGIQVVLREKVSMLEEVLAIPGENPALPLLAKVRASRPENDRMMLPQPSTALRTRELYVSHIRRRHLQKAFWRGLESGLVMQTDSTYLMPLYREAQTFRLQGQQMIPANDRMSQSLILSETDYSALLSIQGNLNFYATTISLLDHPFISPLAANGTTYYKYYLADSVRTESGKRYIVHFRTRNPYYATFDGSIQVDSATYAVCELEANVPAETNVNYLSNLHIRQVFSSDHTLAEEQISTLLDFAVKTDTMHVFPTVLIRHSFSKKDKTSIKPEVYADSLGYVAESVTDDTASLVSPMDSLLQTPLVRTATWFAIIAMTGYIPTGTYVDIGHVQEILQVNEHEGVHFGLPFRTNEKLWRNVSLEAAVGYGWRDQRFKGLGRISWQLPTPRRNIIRLEYQDHYVWTEVDDFSRLMRENSAGLRLMDFSSYAFEALRRDGFCTNTAMRQRQAQFHWEADWTDCLETQTYVRVGWMDDYRYESLSVITRLGWGEKKYDGYFRRRYSYSSLYPVLYLGAEVGSYTRPESNYQLYAHLRLMLTQRASLGMGGTLNYTLQAGWIFGRVPQPMLWQASGNQGYAYDPYRFTLLHNGEILADRYLALHAEWNGQGILFNLLPGVRYLRLRELVETKLAYGYLSYNPQGGLPGVAGRSAFYAELGVGIGNILRVCDLYSVWRLTPNLQPEAPNPVWAMRFRIHLGL